MQEIIYMQRNAAEKLNGRTMAGQIAAAVVRLAIAQMLALWLVRLTGIALLSVPFYLFAAWVAASLVRDAAASYAYVLGGETLALACCLGDSVTRRTEIPLDSVISLREVAKAEDLRTTYRRITAIDAASRPPLRVRAAFKASLISARLARLLAGQEAQAVIGHVLVYREGGALRACTFCPDEQMLAYLQAALGVRYGFDERMTRARIATLYARALERAFPQLYPFVDPLLRCDEVAWAQAELARRKAERQAAKPTQKRRKRPKGKKHTAGKPAQSEAQPTPRRRRKQG